MSAVATKKAKRNILVCIENGCKLCKPIAREVPDKCDYGILHLLESKTGGVQSRKRRSGKTTELMEIARKIANAGQWVYYVTPTLDMSPTSWSSGFLPVVGMKCFSLHQVREGLVRGMRPGYVIMDEIQPGDFHKVMMGFIGSVLVAAYYTDMP